jgi:hypothetical protein
VRSHVSGDLTLFFLSPEMIFRNYLYIQTQIVNCMEKKLSSTVSIKQTETVTPEVISLLKNTLWGTPGQTQYQHLETEETIHDIHSPIYFNLHRLDNLLCTVCLAGRKVNIDEKKVDSHYVRYLAASPAINGNGRRKETSGQRESKGLVKQFMEEVFVKEATESKQPPSKRVALISEPSKRGKG